MAHFRVGRQTGEGRLQPSPRIIGDAQISTHGHVSHHARACVPVGRSGRSRHRRLGRDERRRLQPARRLGRRRPPRGIATGFPSATITASSSLDPAYLSTINVLVISSAYLGANAAIAPLSAAEQTALVNFILGGGSAILVSDNDLAYKAASNSFNNPFGVDVTGTLAGVVTGTVTNPSHPVTNGPFGAPTVFTAVYAGYFESLGVNATSLATFDANGQPGVAVIDRNVLAPGSGSVVFFSDNFPIDRYSMDANDRRWPSMRSRSPRLGRCPSRRVWRRWASASRVCSGSPGIERDFADPAGTAPPDTATSDRPNLAPLVVPNQRSASVGGV